MDNDFDEKWRRKNFDRGIHAIDRFRVNRIGSDINPIERESTIRIVANDRWEAKNTALCS